MSVGHYTIMGAMLWRWEPWLALGMEARMLWLALYTSPEAKLSGVPGLFVGSISTMAEAARMGADTALSALDQLLDHGLVEYDPKARVARLTTLPDAHESPPNGNVIRGWWKRFRAVAPCAVRDAHITTLAWLMEEWCRSRGLDPVATLKEKGHSQAWGETFGTMRVPAPRRRGIRRLLDSDTGTAVQPSLFEPPTTGYPQAVDNSIQNTVGKRDSEHVGSSTSEAPSSSKDLDEEYPPLAEGGNRLGNGYPNRSGNRSPNGWGNGLDQDPDLLFSFPESESEPSGAILPGDHVQGTPVAHAPRPVLTLVPMPTPTPAPTPATATVPAPGPVAAQAPASPVATTPGPVDVPSTVRRFLGLLEEGALTGTAPTFAESHQNALCSRFAELEGLGCGPDETRAAGKWFAISVLRGSVASSVPGTPPGHRLALWAAHPGVVLDAVRQYRAHQAVVAERLAVLDEMRGNLGMRSAPAAPTEHAPTAERQRSTSDPPPSSPARGEAS